MTDSAIAHTNVPNSEDAGATLGTLIAWTFKGERPDALIVFASPTYDYPTLLQALDRACGPKLMVGCSSSGEFSMHGNHDGSACAVALRSSEMQFAAGIGRGLRRDRATAAKALVSSFQGLTRHDYVFRSALVLTDALAGHADDLVEQLTRLTAGTYQFCGGGAGDDAQFRRTHVFCGTEAATDAVVALEILSNTPLGLGSDHGWQPASRALASWPRPALRWPPRSTTRPPCRLWLAWRYPPLPTSASLTWSPMARRSSGLPGPTPIRRNKNACRATHLRDSLGTTLPAGRCWGPGTARGRGHRRLDAGSRDEPGAPPVPA